MRRREFIAGLVGTAWPVLVLAQQSDRVRRIGVLSGLAEDDAQAQARVAAFRQGMRERGWNEGRNLKIDFCWAGADAGRIKSCAAELVGLAPDATLATSSASVAALKQVTRAIPIVFAGIGDPVGQGFVESLARPGGNITGFTGLEFSLGEKWVELLKQVAPNVNRATYIFHPEIGPYYPKWLKSVETAATNFGVEMIAAPVRTVADVERTIGVIAAQPNGGLIVQPDSFTIDNRKPIIESAARHRVPTVYAYRSHTAEGGLVSYGPDPVDQFRQAAAYVDRILRGEKPMDLPVQQPLKYELVFNLKTAKALGLAIPETLLAAADEIIQ
jgi:putative tryptophan/tyrosine transport system substrate-binding protein